MIHRAASLSQIQHGSKGSGNIILGTIYRFHHGKSLCKVGSDGRGKSTSCSVGIGIVDPFSLKPLICSIHIEKIIGIIDLMSALAENCTVILLGNLFCSFDHIIGAFDLPSGMDIKSVLKHVSLDDPKKVFDAGVAAYLLNPLKSSYSHDDIAREYLDGMMLPSKEDLLRKTSLKKAWEEELECLGNYACYQAFVPCMARKVLLEKLDETGMRKVYDEIELPLVFTLDSMEKWGISVKGEELKSYGEKLKVRIGVIQIFIQLCNCLIYGFSEKIDLCGNAGCLGHTDLSGAGTLHGRSGDHRLVHKLQIGDMNLGTDDTHLYKEISSGIRMTGNCSFQIQAENLYSIAKRKIGWLQLFLWLLLLLSGRHSIFGF